MADVEPVLRYINPGWVGVEIGVAEGHSALCLLEHGVLFLYLVDPWGGYPGYQEARDRDAERWEVIYKEAMDRLSPYGGSHGTLRMTSAKAAKYIPDGLDFVWVDGNHAYEFVVADLNMYWPKIREGGVLCGHDYTDNGDTCRVSRAVEEFAAKIGRDILTRPNVDSCWTILK